MAVNILNDTDLIKVQEQLLQCGRFVLNYRQQTLVMGVVNLTPDSFSDGGAFATPQKALAHAEQLLKEGADILDVGAESSRPGATPIEFAQEWQRLSPVLNELVRWNIPISVDTYRPQTMRAALELGVDMVNDIQGFTNNESRAAVLDSQCALCVMHMQNTPCTMQSQPQYYDVVKEVHDFLWTQVKALTLMGMDQRRICIDPGFGFGKRLDDNLNLLRGLSQLTIEANCSPLPILIGWSRKSALGEITGRAVNERLPASLAAALIAINNGATIVRVHDVAATRDVIKMWHCVYSKT